MVGKRKESSSPKETPTPKIVNLTSKVSRDKNLSGRDIVSRAADSNISLTGNAVITYGDDDIVLTPNEFQFVKNQNVEINFEDDEIIELIINQEKSTPGIRCSTMFELSRGLYELQVVAYTDVSSTFFPWARNVKTGVRLTEATHLTQSDEPIIVPLIIDTPMLVEVGILSHNTKVGDTCYIRSISITKPKPIKLVPSSGEFHSLLPRDFRSHGQSELEILPDGLLVTSKPIKTPGSYAILDVTGGETLSVSASISLQYPSVAFLYVADAVSGKELTRRDNVFRSSKDANFDDISTMFTFIQIPEETSSIRIGLLFSTVTKPEVHKLLIRELEVVQFTNLMEKVNEVYVLSLEEEEEKFEFCLQQAKKQGWELSRWPAVNGYDATIKKDWFKYLTEPFTEEDEKLNRKAINQPGAWGYLLTMKSIFEHALLKGHKSIAVFDDDFIISKHFDHKFSRLMQVVGDDWDIIYLGASQWSWDEVTIGSLPYYPPNENTNGSFAVIYRDDTFQRFIDKIEFMRSPFDSGPLRDMVLSLAYGRSFVAYPNIVIANVEKEGIRKSRSQIEYSRRFRWRLTDFPAWFTNWSPTPVKMIDRVDPIEVIHTSTQKPHYVTGVTTLNRLEYLQNFIHSWIETVDQADQTLIIADDGSTDGTIEWIENELILPGIRLILLRNDGRGIARQSNSILDIISTMHPPPTLGFLCNDDIFFSRTGWQSRYWKATQNTGFSHLVYYNTEWKKATQNTKKKGRTPLIGNCTSREAMGCFYTVTPNLIHSIGFFDEDAFPVRGHSHVDFTMRACRIDENEEANLFDIVDSNDYINMMQREGYVSTHRALTYQERIWTSSKECLERREELLQDSTRIFIPKPW